MRERTPQWVTCVSSHSESPFYFSQSNTEEQNTQGFTETLSQPIPQNLTAIFSWNALWYLYAEGVLWARNSAQMGSVKSVSSVRKKNVLREKKNSPPWKKELPKESWCKEIKSPKAYLKIKPLPPSIQEHALLDAWQGPSLTLFVTVWYCDRYKHDFLT